MKTIHFLLFAGILAMIACGAPALAIPSVTGTETFTPYAAGTETALASANSTPFVSDVNVLPTFSFPTTTLPALPGDFSHVLYGGKFHQTSFFLLLGGVSRSGWMTPDQSVARFSGEATYSLHNLEYLDKYFVWGRAPEFSPICNTYSVGTKADVDETGFVATLDGWDVAKRDVTVLSAETEFYQQAVLDWLAAQGVDDPQLGDLQIFRVDLEGDGTDEVFIGATRLDDSQHTTQAGDHSVILMRRVVGNDTLTQFVAGDVYHSKDLELTFPLTYSLANFIDLNQDGTLEVVVEIQGWEKFGAFIFQVDGQTVRETLKAIC